MRLYTLHCVSVRIISCFVLFCCFFAKFFPLVYFAIQKTHFVHNIRGFFLRKSDGNAKRQLNKHIHDTRGEVQIWWNKEHKRIEGKAEKTVNLSIYASQMKRQMRMEEYALVYFNQMSNTLIWNYLSNFFPFTDMELLQKYLLTTFPPSSSGYFDKNSLFVTCCLYMK